MTAPILQNSARARPDEIACKTDAVRLLWQPVTSFQSLSDCGVYELTGRYTDGHFAWRGRVVETDVLVQASADREFVERCCERHAARERGRAE